MIFVAKVLAMVLATYASGQVYWAVKNKTTHPPLFIRLTYSRQYFIRRYWLLIALYSVLAVTGIVVFAQL